MDQELKPSFLLSKKINNARITVPSVHHYNIPGRYGVVIQDLLSKKAQ